MRNSSSRLGKTGLLAIIGVMLACSQLVLAGVVFAHANLERAEPAANSVLDGPPERVTLWFTEPIEPGFSEIQVLDNRGQRVEKGDSRVDRNDPTALSVALRPLSNGTYTVAWRNLSSVDRHQVRGSFFFSVGEPITAAPLGPEAEQPLLQSPVEPLTRWLILLSILAVVGGLSFELLVWRPVLAGKGAGEALRRAGDRLASRTLKLIWVSAVLLIVASLGQLLIQTAGAYDIPVPNTLGAPLASVLTKTE